MTAEKIRKKKKKRPETEIRKEKKNRQPHPPGYKRKKRRRKKHSPARLCFILLLFLLLLGGAGFLLWYFSFEKLDLEEYVAVAYSGYNTKGTAMLSMQESDAYDTFLEDVEIELLSENGSLQNGDLLDIRFIYDEASAKAQKLRIKSDSCQLPVDGLPEGKELSADTLFRDVRIVYEGTAPELTVAVTNESTDPFLKTVSYEITDAKQFYDIGDTISIKAIFSQEAAIANEYRTDSSEDSFKKEVAIESMDRYVRDASQLTMEHIQTLNEKAASLFGSADEYGLRIFSEANLMPIWVNGKTTFVWSNPRLLSAYLNILKPEYFGTAQLHDNDIKLVYMVTLSQADGVACDAEVVVQFTDLLIRADGSYDLALDSGRIIAASYKNAHIRDLVTDSYDEEYEASKLALS